MYGGVLMTVEIINDRLVIEPESFTEKYALEQFTKDYNGNKIIEIGTEFVMENK